VLDRWTKIGHVPRADIQTVEARLRKVENAIKEVEQEEWRKNDPSRKAFAANTASKFQDAVDQIETSLNKAKASGSKDVAKLEAQLTNAKAMLEAAMKHA
jgi:multidrug resistance efflux pump